MNSTQAWLSQHGSITHWYTKIWPPNRTEVQDSCIHSVHHEKISHDKTSGGYLLTPQVTTLPWARVAATKIGALGAHLRQKKLGCSEQAHLEHHQVFPSTIAGRITFKNRWLSVFPRWEIPNCLVANLDHQQDYMTNKESWNRLCAYYPSVLKKTGWSISPIVCICNGFLS